MSFRASLIISNVEIPVGDEYKTSSAAFAAARRMAGQIFMREPVAPPAVSLRVYATDGSSDCGESVNLQYRGVRCSRTS